MTTFESNVQYISFLSNQPQHWLPVPNLNAELKATLSLGLANDVHVIHLNALAIGYGDL